MPPYEMYECEALVRKNDKRKIIIFLKIITN